MDTVETIGGYHVLTWGCQMNDEDSEQIGLFLEQMGYQSVADPFDADVVLLNTCSVRAKPEQKVYSKLGELREAKQQRPEMIIAVCGCMAQVESAQIARRAPYVDLIVGTGNLAAIPDLIRQARERPRGSKPIALLDLPERKGSVVTDIPLRSVTRPARLKAHVPIMYGCDKFCTFCIVPHTRGRERSRPTADVVAEIEALARGGTREVTLLGQTVNSYGKNLAEGRVPFARLLEQVDAIRGLQRIRFTSPYPRDFTDDLIETMARLPKVCEHIHLPVQVADDELLRRMHRGYTVDQFRTIVGKLRTTIPGIAITTDLMLGFPGETDEQYRNTLGFVEEMRFDAAFMFAYSPRPGTPAATMDDQIPQDVKVARLNELIETQNRISAEINRALVGREMEVLVEGKSQRNPSRLTGLTRTFKTVVFPGDARLIGRLARIRTTEGALTGFHAELAE